MPCKATQDGWVIVESSDKTWSTGGGNDKSPQYTCCENPMNCVESGKDMTPKHETPGQKVPDMLLGKRGGQLLIVPETMKRLGQSRNDAQSWMCRVMKVKSDAVRRVLYRNLEG